MTDDDDLRIPRILQLTPEERKLAEAGRRPIAEQMQAKAQALLPATAPPAKPALPEDLREDLARKKKARTDKRIAKLQARIHDRAIPAAFRRWDPRQSKFVDSRIEDSQRLQAAARRLGITLAGDDEMTKIAIVPYLKDSDLPHPRGRTSVKPDASAGEIETKVLSAFHRAGKKCQRVEVVDPNGEVKATWTVDESGEKIDNGNGTILELATVAVAEDQENDMPSKKKSKKQPAAKNGANKPGVIDTIREAMARERGASHEEMLAIATKKFPDRRPEGMASTIKIQAAKLAKRKEKDERRGLVYYA